MTFQNVTHEEYIGKSLNGARPHQSKKPRAKREKAMENHSGSNTVQLQFSTAIYVVATALALGTFAYIVRPAIEAEDLRRVEGHVNANIDKVDAHVELVQRSLGGLSAEMAANRKTLDDMGNALVRIEHKMDSLPRKK